MARPISESDVADTIDVFALAPANAERLGFDGVELRCGHGYFFSEDINRRGDRYGRLTLLERSRFAVEVLKATRSVVAPGFPVILRRWQWEPKDFSARLPGTPGVLEEWLGLLVDTGADAFHLSMPAYWQPAFPELMQTLSWQAEQKK
ncbi:oxidoreductase [Paraburkholderia strydomiana]|uniref:oxidoreductase n=1 Tax=Paraburkholderia strydomiana TaxID=1245417 RepID=UPI002860A538|nr:hypothetical protein [Paraburkholderia strydomiana]MDR7008959.1 2,4-dienoyl-CoA reductase-like NADH-dependent reductase (Old Yellow Enzyme family) [Paraburkholderia strydomiana]